MDAIVPETPRGTDPYAIDGKFAAPDEHAQLLVVGAGPAGIAAALEGARLGLRVVLVDENPVPVSLMGLDVPLFYGQRMNAAVQEPARMVERLVASTPGLAAAFDAGVDVRLGVTAWGLFANGPNLAALPAPVAGLSDGSKSWMCGFGALILAAGARDLVLGFPGVDLPGVMGARALHSLAARYDAFDGKRLLILGSGDLAAQTAILALDRGLDVAGLVEVLPAVQARSVLATGLASRDAGVLTGATILRAEAHGLGLDGAVLRVAGAEMRVACDTICLAIDAVPAIELAAAAGARLTYRGDLGGHVPQLSEHGATTLPGIFCAGDCAGLACETECEAQGQASAQAAANWIETRAPARPSPTLMPGHDGTAYRLAWMRALLADGTQDTPVCLCEEVSRADLLGIKPPRYLGCGPERFGAPDSTRLLQDGPLNPDQIKRLTRAGMGVCQGRRCREQIALLLALDSGIAPARVPLASYRAPVRPLPLGVLADDGSMRTGWDVWFGIRSQWVPYDAIGTDA